MNNDELKAVFDQQAPGYNKQWARLAPINQGLYFLLESVFSELPADARILCVGVGTGNELTYLAKRFPDWHFTAVEPSGAMLDECRKSTMEEGLASRCYFHEGYLDSLPDVDMYHAATCFLVSQFMLDRNSRSHFFQQIASRLAPDGILASADLAWDTNQDDYDNVLKLWQSLMSMSDNSPENLNRIKTMYAKDVAVLPPVKVASLIESSGFANAVQFYQAGLIHAWFATKTD